jgi:rhamnose utilization protein RhaD (predicted bifunctional aldolase and dehydrogenase)
MTRNISATNQSELTQLRKISAQTGSDPLLTQASTGNSSIKLDGVLWIKASSKWMADALHEDILVPLDLVEIRERVKQKDDPAERYERASTETAMHAVLPHRVVLHVHCVNTIAWAVRQDAPARLEQQLDGLSWQWIAFVSSGLPLARKIEKALVTAPDTDVFVLGNHGLVIAGDSCDAVEDLLARVVERLAISPRAAKPANHNALMEIAAGSSWELPEDDEVHTLGTDPISREVLSGGFLYPCQSIFSKSSMPGIFRPVPCPDSRELRESQYAARPFLIIDGYGVIVSRTMTPAQRAMMKGLAQVVQRINSSTPLRYLTEKEIANNSSTTASHYLELADGSRCRSTP